MNKPAPVAPPKKCWPNEDKMTVKMKAKLTNGNHLHVSALEVPFELTTIVFLDLTSLFVMIGNHRGVFCIGLMWIRLRGVHVLGRSKVGIHGNGQGYLMDKSAL